MPLTRPQAVLWDMDGTLVDSEKLWDVSLAELACELGGELSTATREAMIGSNMADTLELMFVEVRRAPEPAARLTGPTGGSPTAPGSCSRVACRGARVPRTRCGWCAPRACPPRWSRRPTGS